MFDCDTPLEKLETSEQFQRLQIETEALQRRLQISGTGGSYLHRAVGAATAKLVASYGPLCECRTSASLVRCDTCADHPLMCIPCFRLVHGMERGHRPVPIDGGELLPALALVLALTPLQPLLLSCGAVQKAVPVTRGTVAVNSRRNVRVENGVYVRIEDEDDEEEEEESIPKELEVSVDDDEEKEELPRTRRRKQDNNNNKRSPTTPLRSGPTSTFFRSHKIESVQIDLNGRREEASRTLILKEQDERFQETLAMYQAAQRVVVKSLTVRRRIQGVIQRTVAATMARTFFVEQAIDEFVFSHLLPLEEAALRFEFDRLVLESREIIATQRDREIKALFIDYNRKCSKNVNFHRFWALQRYVDNPWNYSDPMFHDFLDSLIILQSQEMLERHAVTWIRGIFQHNHSNLMSRETLLRTFLGQHEAHARYQLRQRRNSQHFGAVMLSTIAQGHVERHNMVWRETLGRVELVRAYFESANTNILKRVEAKLRRLWEIKLYGQHEALLAKMRFETVPDWATVTRCYPSVDSTLKQGLSIIENEESLIPDIVQFTPQQFLDNDSVFF
eukprot:PhM_4_TR17534/c0_g1_i1/m.15106